ncbi:hypothetical protein TNCV_1247211 [Trichonephila clavipes]|uniref:Uncharacterized protein n=1 Tax=Trichonephila clavipes TaxID=2585209 RepID=A0A8X6USW8_TRICX|nr:hypothetical protein TNCV_1247211 [Trichonephila clavipes]
MTNSVGLKPVLSCATVLRENNAKGRTPSQSSPDSTHKALITRLMVLCTRSTALLWGWLTDDLVTLMPNLMKKVVVNSLVKEVPRSDCISRGESYPRKDTQEGVYYVWGSNTLHRYSFRVLRGYTN